MLIEFLVIYLLAGVNRNEQNSAKIEHLKEALLTNNYKGNMEVSKSADAISNENETFFDEVICSEIRGNRYKIPMNELIDQFTSHNNISQNVAALLCIDGLLRSSANLSEDDRWDLAINLEKDTSLSADRLFNIHLNYLLLNGVMRNRLAVASYMRHLIRSDEYENLSETYKTKIQDYKNTLSESVKNLYFSSVICISVGDQYIENEYDERDQGNKLKLRNKSNEPGQKWFAKQIADREFKFENAENRTDNIYVRNMSKNVSRLGIDSDQENLLVYPKEVNFIVWYKKMGIFFYNQRTKQYLCAEESSEELKGDVTTSYKCLWQINDCSD